MKQTIIAFAAAATLAPALPSSAQAHCRGCGSAFRRLDWFYRKSPAWDERVNLLPIYRADKPLPAAAPPR